MQRPADTACIDAPELLTRREQLRDTLVTGFMWMLYAYLWLPLISFMAWVLGFEFAYDVMIRAGGAARLRLELYWYVAIVAMIFVAFGTWSLSNRLRFSAHNRREAMDRVSDQSYMAYFGISADELALLRNGRTLALELDAVGAIREIGGESSASGFGHDTQGGCKKSADDQ